MPTGRYSCSMELRIPVSGPKQFPCESVKRGMRKFPRRHLLRALLASPLGIAADAIGCEPRMIKVRRIKVENPVSGLRWAHFTDVHHKGDRAHLERAVK